MPPTFVRPENRQRSGNGPHLGGEGADGRPDGLRSEAFAEDLVLVAGLTPPPRAFAAFAAVPRRARGWGVSFSLWMAAAFGPRGAGAVD